MAQLTGSDSLTSDLFPRLNTMWLYRADQVAQVVTAINPLSFEQFKNGQLF